MNVSDIIGCLVKAGAPEDFLGRCRINEYAWARFVLYERLRREGMSLNAIGLVVHRNHSSVYQGIRRAKQMIEWPSIYPEFNELRNKLEEYENELRGNVE